MEQGRALNRRQAKLDQRITSALNELRTLISTHYSEAQFEVLRDVDDPAAIHLATIDAIEPQRTFDRFDHGLAHLSILWQRLRLAERIRNPLKVRLTKQFIRCEQQYCTLGAEMLEVAPVHRK